MMSAKTELMSDYLNEAETIEFLGLRDSGRDYRRARESLRWLIRKHNLPAVKFCGVKMFPVSELRRYLDEHMVRAR